MTTAPSGRVPRRDEWLTELFEAHAVVVFRVAYAYLRDPQEAQDVVQDTFMVAWRKQHAIRLVDGSALPWLLTTAKFIAMARRRGEARRRTDSLSTEALADTASPRLSDDAVAVREALALLTQPERRVVELILIDGFDYAQAAERLGLTVAATGKRLQRARARLRLMLLPQQSATPSAERTTS